MQWIWTVAVHRWGGGGGPETAPFKGYRQGKGRWFDHMFWGWFRQGCWSVVIFLVVLHIFIFSEISWCLSWWLKIFDCQFYHTKRRAKDHATGVGLNTFPFEGFGKCKNSGKTQQVCLEYVGDYILSYLVSRCRNYKCGLTQSPINDRGIPFCN